MKKQFCPIYSASVRTWAGIGAGREENEVSEAHSCILFLSTG